MSPIENDPAQAEAEAQAAPAAENAEQAVVSLLLGFDLGNCTSVVAAGTAGSPVGKADLVMNEMSNRATPTMASFHGNERSVGEAAQGQLGVNAQNTVNHLLRIVGKDMKELAAHPDQHLRFSMEADDQGRAAVKVSYKGEDLKLLPEQLLGMLLAQLAKHARGSKTAEEAPVAATVLSVPGVFSDRQKDCVRVAAEIAGLHENLTVVDSLDAAASCLNVQHAPVDGPEAAPVHVMILDAGHAFTSCAVYKLVPGSPPERLSHSASDSIGGYTLDRAVFNEFQAQVEANGVSIKAGSRPGYRLMVECEKVKRTLSTITETSTVLECVGENEKDIKLTITRAKFEELCSNERAGLAAMVDGVVKGAGLSPADISAVELAGGSSRVPWVRKVVADAFGGNESILGSRLDSSSCFALGAGFMAEAITLKPMLEDGFKNPAVVEKLRAGISRAVAVPVPSAADAAESSSRWTPDAMQAAVALEKEMQRQDAEEAAKADARNSLESFILQMRSAVSEGKHGGSLKEDLVGPLLDTAEDWMYGDGEESDLAGHQEYLKGLNEKVRSACPAWFEAEEAERMQIEEELTAQYQAALKEAEGKDKEDHDFRKMAKPERMRLVNLNKEEANELFKGGNVAPAVQRWQKALQHAGKFFDLSEDDKKEVDALTLSLHLNIAMGYLKIADTEAAKDTRISKDSAEQTLRKVQESCTAALTIDSKCAKALFRRATAMEKLKYLDEAFKDCKAALDIEPDDKMIIRLYERVKKLRAQRLEKEKTFAKKMFG